MNDYVISVLLGIVEGLTEFLPVSSTAHLRITEALLHLDLQDSFWKSYSIVIQLGAILALPVYFRSRIIDLVTTFPRGMRGDRTVLTHPLSLTLIAFVVTAIPSYLLKKQIGQNLESLTLMAWALIVGGIVMWVVDAMFNRPNVERLDDMNLPRAIWIGAVQILSAVFPGTSRSMCTIAAGQMAGLSRATALEFSFFLSMPTMIVATGYDLLTTMRGHHDADAALAPAALTGHQWRVLAVGGAVSFIVALVVVAWFMRWVRARGFVPFAIYRIAAGIILLIAVARGLI
ncbi:MAG TPA: undecaprenyl-diphosphate phosphatase [Chthoniobacterales bacterium]|nr:undecaprenyl-diphosphate phosphatase [Chthoniobacterales bacterium]